MYAARLWWMMRWLGHGRVLVLDGGMRRWLHLGLPLEDHAPRAAAPGNFVARPRPAMTADATAVLVSTRDPSARLLDARGAERYRGEIEPIDAVAGHVPGARNHPFTLSLGTDGCFLPRAELRAALQERLAGVPPERTVAMCGSGVSACHLLLAMEHAGLGGARLYAGSWSEWSRDPSRPVAVGADP
jgi:thiosulfate/3-mercaptopyruvate sulfurtransferase